MLIIDINMALRHILNVLISIVIIILSTSKFTKSDTEVKYNALNDYLIPSHYDVIIEFDAYRNAFSGNCYIKIQIVRPTKNIIIINSKIFVLKLLKIDLINYDNNQSVNIQKYCLINNTYILAFTQSSVDFLSPGRYILKIKYESTIFDDGDFFGESFYTDEEEVLNNESIMIIKAQQLFPCLNETVFELTFNISIKHYKGYKFLSNIPIYKEVDDLNNMQWTQFYTLSSMSAEHLTFVVATINYELIPFSTTNVTFWHRKEITKQMRYAKSVVHRVVQYLIQKTTRKLAKMDYIVIKDFQYSNVKIQGCILLREEDVIYNDTLDHIACKMEVAHLIARETISHWYDDVFLWSKDGFIAFLAAHILDQTELYRIDLFVVQTLQESLRFDTLPLSSHAYNSTVHSFRTSLHSRKSSVIWRMLYNLISDNVFWTGVNRYVNTQYNQTNAADNVSTISFWTTIKSALNEKNNISNFNTIDLVDILLDGYYPVLHVTQNHYTHKTLIFNRDFKFPSMVKPLYRIFLTYTTKSVMNFETFVIKTWLSPSTPYYYVNDVNYDDWIIVNLQQIGYYRVNYDVYIWQKLEYHLSRINYTHIPVSNRAQIVDDAFYFMMLGQLNFNLFLDIVSFLVEDTDYIAWYPMIKAVEYMTCIWAIQDSIFAKNKIKNMFYGLLLNIGYDDKFDESDFTKCLREEAVKWACVLDVFQCRTAATLQLEKHLESSVQDEVLKWKEWIYCKGLMAASFSTWQKVLYKWNTTSDNTILEYSTCSTDPILILSYLEFIKLNHLYSKILNDKAIANIFLLLIAKHARNDVVLNYIFNHLELFNLSRNRQVDEIAVLIVIITHEHDPNQLKKIIEFVKNNSTISSKRLVAVKQKINKRKTEYGKQIAFYGRSYK